MDSGKITEVDDAPKTVDLPSYQVLMEGLAELIVSNEKTGDKINVSELLRDLYKKNYELRAKIQTLTPPSS